MSKLIKHKWKLIRFGEFECIICGCMKMKIARNFSISSKLLKSIPQYFYFRSGQQLSGLPECKIIFHNDKI